MEPNSTLSPGQNYSKLLDQSYEIRTFGCFIERWMQPSPCSTHLLFRYSRCVCKHLSPLTLFTLTPKSSAVVSNVCWMLRYISSKRVNCVHLKQSLHQNPSTCVNMLTLNNLPSPVSPFLTVEWQRKPNTTMTMAGVRMVPNTSPARQALIAAMTRFWAVTSTEQAQQSRDPRSSRGASPLSAAE